MYNATLYETSLVSWGPKHRESCDGYDHNDKINTIVLDYSSLAANTLL